MFWASQAFRLGLPDHTPAPDIVAYPRERIVDAPSMGQLCIRIMAIVDATPSAMAHKAGDNPRQALMDKYGLTGSDLGGKAGRTAKAKSARAPVAPKYRDPVSGATWTGRGKPPKWTVGKDLSKYTI